MQHQACKLFTGVWEKWYFVDLMETDQNNFWKIKGFKKPKEKKFLRFIWAEIFFPFVAFGRLRNFCSKAQSQSQVIMRRWEHQHMHIRRMSKFFSYSLSLSLSLSLFLFPSLSTYLTFPLSLSLFLFPSLFLCLTFPLSLSLSYLSSLSSPSLSLSLSLSFGAIYRRIRKKLFVSFLRLGGGSSSSAKSLSFNIVCFWRKKFLPLINSWNKKRETKTYWQTQDWLVNFFMLFANYAARPKI